MDEPGHPLLAHAALPGDEHGRVHWGHAPSQLDHPPHLRAASHHARRERELPRRARQGLFALGELPLGADQLRGDLAQRHLEPLLLEEGQVRLQRGAPALACLRVEVAGRVPAPDAAVLQDIDALALDAAEIAAGEATERPADRHVRAPRVQQVLLRLVGALHRGALGRERILRAGPQADEPLERVDGHRRRAGPGRCPR